MGGSSGLYTRPEPQGRHGWAGREPRSRPHTTPPGSFQNTDLQPFIPNIPSRESTPGARARPLTVHSANRPFPRPKEKPSPDSRFDGPGRQEDKPWGDGQTPHTRAALPPETDSPPGFSFLTQARKSQGPLPRASTLRRFLPSASSFLTESVTAEPEGMTSGAGACQPRPASPRPPGSSESQAELPVLPWRRERSPSSEHDPGGWCWC